MKSKGPSISRFRPKKGKKPPAKTSMEATVPRKLSEPEINERSRRLARKQVELNAHEARKRKLTKDVNEDIKAAKEEVEKLASEVVKGMELLPQGDLFADGSTKIPSQGQAVKGVVEVVKHAGATAPADGKGTEAPAP